jgi:hypothetical protein
LLQYKCRKGLSSHDSIRNEQPETYLLKYAAAACRDFFKCSQLANHCATAAALAGSTALTANTPCRPGGKEPQATKVC